MILRFGPFRGAEGNWLLPHQKTPFRNTERSCEFQLQLGSAVIESARSYNRRRLLLPGVSAWVSLLEQRGPRAF